MTPDREPLWLTWSELRPTLARTGARWKKTFPDWMRAHRRWALNYENLRAEVVPGSSPLEPDPLVLALYAELGRRREFDGHAHVAGAGVALALQTVLLAFAIPGDGIWSLHFAAALAALGIAIASLQTMGKHRYHQSVDARQMALLGTRMGARALGIVVHGEPGERLAFARAMGISTGQFAQISSHGVWLWALRITVVLDLLVIVVKLICLERAAVVGGPSLAAAGDTDEEIAPSPATRCR